MLWFSKITEILIIMDDHQSTNEEMPVPTTSKRIRWRCSAAARIASKRKHNSQYRENERREDAARRAISRSQPEVHEREQAANTVQRRQSRNNVRVSTAERVANTTHQRTIVSGDFNLAQNGNFANFLEVTFGLKLCNTVPTTTSNTTIELLFTTDSVRLANPIVDESMFSFHKPVFFKFTN
jgi:hypothetical protein